MLVLLVLVLELSMFADKLRAQCSIGLVMAAVGCLQVCMDRGPKGLHGTIGNMYKIIKKKHAKYSLVVLAQISLK